MFGLNRKKLQGQKVVLEIAGMHCSSCALRIDTEIEELEGVLRSSTSYARQRVTVVYDPHKLNQAQIEAKILSAGYRVVSVNHHE